MSSALLPARPGGLPRTIPCPRGCTKPPCLNPSRGCAANCAGADVYIVTVPTPVDADRNPDLGPLLDATRMIARAIDPARRPTIVYESTVYPGVTEEICGGLLEEQGTRSPNSPCTARLSMASLWTVAVPCRFG